MNIFSSKVCAQINCLLSTVYLLHNPKLFVNGSLAKKIKHPKNLHCYSLIRTFAETMLLYV